MEGVLGPLENFKLIRFGAAGQSVSYWYLFLYTARKLTLHHNYGLFISDHKSLVEPS